MSTLAFLTRPSRFLLGSLLLLSPAAFAQQAAEEPAILPDRGVPAVGVPAAPAAEEQGDAGNAPVRLTAAETAKELANPNTALASLTLKSQLTSWDGSLLPDGQLSGTFLFQPSMPFPVNDTDRIYLRPALSVLVNQPVADASGNVRGVSGFGDLVMDLAYGRTFKSGWILLAGTVTSIPIGADGLSSRTWSLGPEFFVGHGFKWGFLGLLPNHQWNVVGDKEVSLTTIQPIVTFLLGDGWALGTSPLINHNWIADQWTVPIQLQLSNTVMIGKLPLKLALEFDYYAVSPSAVGQNWFIGFNIIPVVPNVLANWLSGK
jgi:hypothetical protein